MLDVEEKNQNFLFSIKAVCVAFYSDFAAVSTQSNAVHICHSIQGHFGAILLHYLWRVADCNVLSRALCLLKFYILKTKTAHMNVSASRQE